MISISGVTNVMMKVDLHSIDYQYFLNFLSVVPKDYREILCAFSKLCNNKIQQNANNFNFNKRRPARF